MLQPQQQPPINTPIYNGPFVGLNFKLHSIANPSNIHYLKIATEFNNIYFVGYPYYITGTWEGGSNDVHHMTGHIAGDLSFSCSWSTVSGSPPDRFLTGTLTNNVSGWKLDGAVRDGNGNLVGPGYVTGVTV
jgi:hypothetical protein